MKLKYNVMEEKHQNKMKEFMIKFSMSFLLSFLLYIYKIGFSDNDNTKQQAE